MISYTPLWKTMEENGITTYTLINKYGISSRTINNLKHNKGITVYTLERLCENSIYAYKNQICQGYLTIKGGHRIGITGTVVEENNRILNIKHITSLNFRIARQIRNCSNPILKEIVDIENQTIYNTLIVAPPGKGKTTILRDAIRKISNGINEINFKGKTCGVVDERGEIAAMYKGVPQNDIGMRTDVVGLICPWRMYTGHIKPAILYVPLFDYAAGNFIPGISRGL